MADEVKTANGNTSTKVPSENVATTGQIVNENTKDTGAPDVTGTREQIITAVQPLRPISNGTKESSQSIAHPSDRLKRCIDSESGTEADDEHFLLGAPASRTKHKKELKKLERTISTTSASGLSDEQDGTNKRKSGKDTKFQEKRTIMEAFSRRRRVEFLRRVSEVGLLVGVGFIVYSGDEQRQGKIWKMELASEAIIIGSLMALYPIRLLYYLASHNSFERWPSIVVPSAFDPAVLLYPPLLANYASILLADGNGPIVLINMALGVSSLLTELLPSFTLSEGVPNLHWLLSCIPIFIWQTGSTSAATTIRNEYAEVAPEEYLTYLFPLHRMMCAVLRQVASTSLLETEVQLLSIALINLLYLAASPPTIVLKALLWIGGVSLALFATPAFKWLVAIERVPKWRFRRVGSPKHALKSQPKSMLKEPLSKLSQVLHFDRPPTLDSEDEVAEVQRVRPMTMRSWNAPSSSDLVDGGATSDAKVDQDEVADTVAPLQPSQPITSSRAASSPTHTPSGRKKHSRSASKSLAKFYSLTETEATIRKYIYASYIYILIILTAFLGVWKYVYDEALGGLEPVGWALSYLFGDLQWFRWKVTLWNLNSWIVLPPHRHASNSDDVDNVAVGGWIEQYRHDFGHANTRLLISGYLLTILLIGLTTVLSLSSIPTVAVDTRRKVFHFMMVAMLIPTIFVDPTYIAFALSLILAVFLLLDLLRSGCVPPISKPLNWFLEPYVDGRDLRGPVVVSHIFLLIGCAIPLWLSLGCLHLVQVTEGEGWAVENRWDVQGRDVSMLAGVICVGMGDAFASLIGRRWGKNKWIWPGGKSIEGSVAFAVVVTLSLLVGNAYLRLGGWEDIGMKIEDWPSAVAVAGKSVLAATVASLTEAVLTGGNDNVVVPIIFWMTVKGLRI